MSRKQALNLDAIEIAPPAEPAPAEPVAPPSAAPVPVPRTEQGLAPPVALPHVPKGGNSATIAPPAVPRRVERKVPVNVRINESVADRLHALAYHARREKQEIVQTALEAYLASEGA
jgi:hypothetical protein